MRIRREHFWYIIVFCNFIFFSFLHTFRIMRIQDGHYIDPSLISAEDFQRVFVIAISVITFVALYKRQISYGKIKNLKNDLCINSKSYKKSFIFYFLAFIFFALLYALALKNFVSLIVLVCGIIYFIFEIKWLKKEDGFYGELILYEGSLLFKKNIESCLINQENLLIIVTKKCCFLKLIHRIDLHINPKEIEVLESLLKGYVRTQHKET